MWTGCILPDVITVMIVLLSDKVVITRLIFWKVIAFTHTILNKSAILLTVTLKLVRSSLF